MAGGLRSMTGFGQAQGELSPRLSAQVRVTSLNSRFLEVTVRTHPRVETAELEAALRPVLAGRLVNAENILDLPDVLAANKPTIFFVLVKSMTFFSP